MLNIVAALDLGKNRKRVAQPNRQPIKSRSRLNNTSSRATGAERCWRYLTLTAQSKASVRGGCGPRGRRIGHGARSIGEILIAMGKLPGVLSGSSTVRPPELRLH